jgi:hypothetical protein
VTDKKQADLTQSEKHKLLSRPRSQSTPDLTNGARTRLIRTGSMPELPFEAGNQAVTGVIEKVTTDLEALMRSAQDRTDALFGIGPLAPGHRQAEEPSPAPKKNQGSTKAKGWKQFKRRVGEFFGTKKSKESVIRREKALSEKYGITIGPGEIDGDVHMTHTMLDRIEKILDQLPVSHVSGNDALKGISGNQGDQAASTYDSGEKVIGINRPFNMPGWLYSILNPYWKIQRAQMEKGAMADYHGITDAEDEALGIDKKSRSVFAGVNDVLAQENLLQNTVRHEVGHSVDEKIGWEANESDKEMFGGWRKHFGLPGAEEVAKAFLARAGLEEQMGEPVGPTKKPLYTLFAVQMVGASRNFEGKTRPDPANIVKFENMSSVNSWLNGHPGTRDKLRVAIESARVALAQAWTLPDGGGDRVTYDGRMYHMGHYENWVSYRAEARTNALSNYQFSTPGEWFAEAYTAYYNPEDPAPRSQLVPEVREWFEEQLGPPQTAGTEGRNQGEGELGESGTLGTLG